MKADVIVYRRHSLAEPLKGMILANAWKKKKHVIWPLPQETNRQKMSKNILTD